MTARSSWMGESITAVKVSRENDRDCLHWLGGMMGVTITVPTGSVSLRTIGSGDR